MRNFTDANAGKVAHQEIRGWEIAMLHKTADANKRDCEPASMRIYGLAKLRITSLAFQQGS